MISAHTRVSVQRARAGRRYGRADVAVPEARDWMDRGPVAEILYETVRDLSRNGPWRWIVTLRPEMNPATVTKYRALEGARQIQTTQSMAQAQDTQTAKLLGQRRRNG